MSDEEIYRLARQVGLALGMKPKGQGSQKADQAWDKLLAFARAIEKRSTKS